VSKSEKEVLPVAVMALAGDKRPKRGGGVVSKEKEILTGVERLTISNGAIEDAGRSSSTKFVIRKGKGKTGAISRARNN